VAVAEERHFTRAAARLSVAQPAVSTQVRRLEAELGAELFHRGAREASLTAAGQVLLPLARHVLASVDEVGTQIRELDALRHGQLALGATPSLTVALVPAVLARFHERYPGVRLQLAEAGSRDLVGRLEGGELDLALVILPLRHEHLHTTALAVEELVLAVPAEHRLSRRRRVTIGDLAGVPLVMFREGYDLRAATVAACREAGFEPSFVTEGGEMDGVLALVSAGIGAAVVPSIVVLGQSQLRAIRFSDPPLRRTIGLAHVGDRRLSRAGEALVQELRSVLRERGWPGQSPPALRVLSAQA
jgi:DNA-binding transcriptional LysR family regulator